ncbi:MAG: putative oxidoreductase [Variibacter sp.]|jgi:putative oxidoreductase|nr:putative oxidoreductase [Variibacter sp.]
MTDAAFLVARICLGLIFVISGWGKLMAVAGIATALQRAGLPSPQALGYVVGAIELVGGLMVIAGFLTRWAALALAAFTVGTIYIGHPFWAVAADQYMAQRTQALKNLAIVGGYLMLAFAGPGRFSLDGTRRRA